jgi:hypothetical protein
MFDESTHSCPAGYILYQFSTIIESGKEVNQVNKVEKGKEGG